MRHGEMQQVIHARVAAIKMSTGEYPKEVEVTGGEYAVLAMDLWCWVSEYQKERVNEYRQDVLDGRLNYQLPDGGYCTFKIVEKV